MTVTANIDTSYSAIGVTVPDARRAAEFLASLFGVDIVRRSAANTSVPIGAASSVDFTTADSPDQLPPRLVDLGTNHLCLTVGDIERAAAYLDSLDGVSILGDIVTVPEGPIAGNKWVYFRSPWGALFELQQWPDEPAYFRETEARLRHSREDLAGALLPTCRGLDHTGYSVPDLDAAVARLVNFHSATEVLRTEIAADRAFMTAQFDLDVEGTSRMAMVAIGDLNVELFQHSVGSQEGPRSSAAVGGNHLTLPSAGSGLPDAVRLIPGSL